LGRALLLNASFEPLCVVSERRAVVLVLKEKAEVMERTAREMHAERLSVPVPSVIRLRRFVRVPYRNRVPLSRRAVFVRDGHRCQYCNGPAENIDHVVPRSRGGDHSWENVVAACRPCNTRKEDRMLDESGLRLLRAPRAPHSTLWLVANGTGVESDWGRYLPDLDASSTAAAAAGAVPA